jgi:chorismate-pyruvate lyase
MTTTPAWLLAPCLIATATPAHANFAQIKHVEMLSARLLASNSATATLETWCTEFGISDAGTITATRLDKAPRAPSAEQRQRLGIGTREAVAYRKVALMCGTETLSIAENWYVPSRLTPAMRAALVGETPFGRVIAPLRPERVTLSTRLLWRPGTASIPDAVLEHRALVLGAEGVPLAEVVERYTKAVVGKRQ